MDLLAEISDEEFVPFLHSLGVDTYKKSFEWILNNPDCGFLQWLYNSLDHSNALTAREEYRYNELEKNETLMSSDDLELTLSTILQQHEGIPLPGDRDAKEDVKMDKQMQKERLNLLEKQEIAIENLIQQNKQTNEELNCEITKLIGIQKQCKDEELAASEECLSLAKEVERTTDFVVDVVADRLTLYSSCHADKEASLKFFAFGPFESYRQSQALFRSHFDLFSSKRFTKKQNEDAATEHELRCELMEAKNLEGRLMDALCVYVESKAELSGEQAKLALVADYENVHPSQIAVKSMEARSAVDVLEQEELIVDQMLQDNIKQFVQKRTKMAVHSAVAAVLSVRELVNQMMQNNTKQFVQRRTKKAVHSAVAAVLSVREEIHRDLSWLQEATQQALALDKLLYYALRHELRTVHDLLEFAGDLRDYVLEESNAVLRRVEAMNSVCYEQDLCDQKLQSNDPLINALNEILGTGQSCDVTQLIKFEAQVQKDLRVMQEDVVEGFKRKEEGLAEFIKSSLPLRRHLFDGCSKRANCRDRCVAALTHGLARLMADIDGRVADTTARYHAVSNGDKKNMRKLWQWFLADPQRLLACVQDAQTRSYS